MQDNIGDGVDVVLDMLVRAKTCAEISDDAALKEASKVSSLLVLQTGVLWKFLGRKAEEEDFLKLLSIKEVITGVTSGDDGDGTGHGEGEGGILESRTTGE